MNWQFFCSGGFFVSQFSIIAPAVLQATLYTPLAHWHRFNGLDCHSQVTGVS